MNYSPLAIQRLQVNITFAPSANRTSFSRPSASSSDAFLTAEQLCCAFKQRTGHPDEMSCWQFTVFTAVLVGSKCSSVLKLFRSAELRTSQNLILLSGVVSSEPQKSIMESNLFWIFSSLLINGFQNCRLIKGLKCMLASF